MPIFDFFELPEKGVIVSGSNSAFNGMNDEEIKDLFDADIIILFPDGKNLLAHVEAVDVARSVINQVNVNVCLGTTIQSSELKIGSKVCSLI